MLAAGADVKEIQTQLGHRSPMITLSIYTHLFEDAFDSVMDRRDAAHRVTWCGPTAAQTSSSFPSRGRHKSLTRGYRQSEGCPSGRRRRS